MWMENKLRTIAGWGAGWVMWLLLALSVVVVAVALERAIVLFLSKDDFGSLRRHVTGALARRDWAAAESHAMTSSTFEGRVVAAALSALPRGATAFEQRLASEGQLTRLAMEKRLAILGTVGSNAPFVGLLGTVIGVIRAFVELDASGGQVSTALMADIGEALTATAVGLFVALPAVVLFNLFRRQIEIRMSRADALGREILSCLPAEHASAEVS